MHYRRFQRHGDPLVNKRPEQVIGPLEARFWAKVDKTGECWLWQGRSLVSSGYGQFGLGGRRAGTELAHRVSYRLAFGAIPIGLEISHTCPDPNPICVNPAHLVAETHAENLHRSATVQFKVNAAKTHCKWGHPFDAANTYMRKRTDGGFSRECRECVRVAQIRSLSKRGTVPNS